MNKVFYLDGENRPAERQQLLILKFVDGMSNAEIARVMGRSEGAVKSLYHRTLIALRDDLNRPPPNPTGKRLSPLVASQTTSC